MTETLCSRCHTAPAEGLCIIWVVEHPRAVAHQQWVLRQFGCDHQPFMPWELPEAGYICRACRDAFPAEMLCVWHENPIHENPIIDAT